MFGLFGKKNVFLGVDFGSSAVKVVEITYRNQRPYLSNYGYAAVADAAQAGDVLRAVLHEMKTSARQAYVALSGSSGLVTLITFPRMSDAELSQAILFEARKHIPIPLDDVNVSWDVVGRERPAGAPAAAQQPAQLPDKTDVLLVAAPRKDVEVCEQRIQGSSLDLRALELETFSLVRSLIGDDNGNFLIIDIGAFATNIVLVTRGVVRASRNVGIGGDAMTQSIADAMGVDRERAEGHKRTAAAHDGVLGMSRSVADSIVEEARRVLKAGGQTSVDSVLLTGGGSMVAGLDGHIAKAIGMAVSYGDPWARVTVEASAAPYAQQLQGQFAVAIGLALRGVDEYRRQ